MNKRVIGLFFLVGAFFISLASASFSFDDETIDTSYLAGDYVRGEVYMNFTNEPNGNFTSNFKGGMSLFDVLESMGKRSGRDFICDPVSCTKTYKDDGNEGKTVRDFTVLGKKNVGVKVIGNNFGGVESFNFKVVGRNSAGSCTNQFEMDVLGDGILEGFNEDYSPTETCGEKNYGCYTSNSASATSAIIQRNSAAYCEKMNLSAAPAYEVGAVVEHVEGRQGKISFGIFNANDLGNALASRSLGSGIGSGEQKTILEYSSPVKFEALVCIWDDEFDGTPNYKIKAKTGTNSCGGSLDSGVLRVGADYEIYSRAMKYAPFGELVFDGEEIIEDINGFIEEIYGGDCSSPEGCLVPIKFFSNSSSDFTIKEVQTTYQSGAGLTLEDKTYEIVEDNFRISANRTKIDIEKMKFVVPEKNGNEKFTLNFGGRKIIEEDIEIKKGFDFTINPRFALIGRGTTFRASVEQGVISSRWKFGDGSSMVISDDNSASHTYTEQGNYTIEVTLDKSNSTSTKKFEVVVGDPEESARITLADYDGRVNKIEREINAFGWVSESIKEIVSLEELKGEIRTLKVEFEDARNDEEYLEVVNALLSMDIPYSVFVSEEGTLPIEVGFNNIDLKYIEEISDSIIGEGENEAKINIIDWAEKNYDVKLMFTKYSVLFIEGQEEIAGSYSVSFEKLDDEAEGFLIIPVPVSELVLRTDYSEKPLDEDGAIFIELVENGEVSFMIVGDSLPSVEQLGIYVAPELREIKPVDEKPFASNLYDSEGNFRWGFFLVWMAVIVAGFLTVYVILQSWYRRYYERHLFKNPDDLYNMINFVYNSRKSGIDDKESRQKLKERKWGGEQITYVFRKIDGKRTGMFEIPVFKFVENRRVMNELQKKHPGEEIDARFIKRPEF